MSETLKQLIDFEKEKLLTAEQLIAIIDKNIEVRYEENLRDLIRDASDRISYMQRFFATKCTIDLYGKSPKAIADLIATIKEKGYFAEVHNTSLLFGIPENNQASSID